MPLPSKNRKIQKSKNESLKKITSNYRNLNVNTIQHHYTLQQTQRTILESHSLSLALALSKHALNARLLNAK